jgi:hypothetical protein
MLNIAVLGCGRIGQMRDARRSADDPRRREDDEEGTPEWVEKAASKASPTTWTPSLPKSSSEREHQ